MKQFNDSLHLEIMKWNAQLNQHKQSNKKTTFFISEVMESFAEHMVNWRIHMWRYYRIHTWRCYCSSL